MPVKYLTDESVDGYSYGQTSASKISFFGATPVVRPTALPVNGSDAATTQALANAIKANLITLGLCV